MIRVMVVDDEAIVRCGIALLLAAEADIQVVAEAGNGAEALAAVAEAQPDVAVVDLRMPAMNGVELTERLAATVDGPAVVVLTTFNADDAAYSALRAGAVGFLLKDAAPAELVAAIRAVAAGEGWLDPAVARALMREFASRPEAARPAPAAVASLTAREREVLVLVAHGLSNADIAAHLVVGEATVRTHVSHILTKLGLRDRAQAAAVAYHSGLLRPGDAVPPGPGTASVRP